MEQSTWEIKIIGQNEGAIRFRLKQEKVFLTFKNVLTLWQISEPFRTFYLSIFINTKFDAYYWEHPGLKRKFLDKTYECVLMNSPYLDRRLVDTDSFLEYFDQTKLIVDFNNLGKNARLIVPTPQDEPHHYKHLARFMRSPQTAQKHELLKTIGQLVLGNLNPNNVLWLNTAGAGVIWLHIRLDSRPKYYKTRRYKDPDFLV